MVLPIKELCIVYSSDMFLFSSKHYFAFIKKFITKVMICYTYYKLTYETKHVERKMEPMKVWLIRSCLTKKKSVSNI